jgi:hypothetical protein
MAVIKEGLRLGSTVVLGFIVLIVLIVVTGILKDGDVHPDYVREISDLVLEIEQVDRAIQMERLLNAIAVVESQGDPNAIGDRGTAKGMYQLSRVYIEDVERIVGGDIRYSPEISRACVIVYLNHYATKERLGFEPTFEDMARIHNGGPDGLFDGATEGYWFKVKAVLDGRR